MPVPTLITDLSTDANSNSPPGTESAKGNIDNYLRAAFAFNRQNYNLVAGSSATLASAATVAIGAAAVNNVVISGTTTITAFDTYAEGAIRDVVFSGVLTLTHNATTLQLPGSANITTAAGDYARFKSLGSGNWKCLSYQKVSGIAANAGSNSDITALTALQSLNGGPLAGLRNALINGAFGINQRGVSGTVTLAAGAYGHDRWKAGAAGCAYTFATSGGHTVITITAGSLMQVIEGANVETGPYVLSHQGSAQARIAVNGAATSGAYAVASTASPLSASPTGGQNVTVEFSTGTVDRAQFEPGTVATPFERRPYGLELALCQRYYEAGQSTVLTAASAANQNVGAPVTFKMTKRALPTVAMTRTYGANCSATTSAYRVDANGFIAYVTSTASVALEADDTWTASAEL